MLQISHIIYFISPIFVYDININKKIQQQTNEKPKTNEKLLLLGLEYYLVLKQFHLNSKTWKQIEIMLSYLKHYIANLGKK